MNIALFVDTYFPQLNGVATVVHQLQTDLISLGAKVYVLTPKRPNSVEMENVFHCAARPSLVGKNEYIATVSHKEIVKFCLEKNIDILHAHSEFRMAKLAIKASKELKIPFVITFHTFWEHYMHYMPCSFLIPRGFLRAYLWYIYRNANLIYAVSQKVIDYLKPIVPKNPIMLLENAIDRKALQSSTHTQQDLLNLKDKYKITEDVVFLYVGRISHEKRLKELLNIFKEVHKVAKTSTRLILVGDGPAKEEIIALSEKLELSNSVTFTGFIQREELSMFFNISDIFVSASVSETYSMTVTESLSFNVPVVLRDDASYYDRVNSENGFMLKTDTELQKTLIKLADNPEMLAKLKETTKASFKELTSLEQAKKYLNTYVEVIKAQEKN